jgi:aminoglycoside phosphotransferase (APT) family kinase protein
VVRALCALHQSTFGQSLAGPAPYLPRWDKLMTAAALSCLPTEVAGHVREPLLALADSAQDLFARQCCISGDPNPTNWGIRSSGNPVLFDWERFGYGTPALDLAISLPGLGSVDGDVERRVAAHYTALCQALYGTADGDAKRLALSIRTGKVWAAVEFLDKHAQGLLPEHARANALRIAELLPAVVAAVASGL